MPKFLFMTMVVFIFSYRNCSWRIFWRIIFWRIFLTNFFNEFFDDFFCWIFSKNFFDELFWRTLLSNFFDEFIWRTLLTKMFDELFWQSFLTYNLLTIASFRIRVPSILFFQKYNWKYHLSTVLGTVIKCPLEVHGKYFTTKSCVFYNQYICSVVTFEIN